MRVLLCLLFGASLPLYSQRELAIIDDPAGYTNVRAMESSESEIVGILYDNQAFYLSDFDDLEKDWLTVSYSGYGYSVIWVVENGKLKKRQLVEI